MLLDTPITPQTFTDAGIAGGFLFLIFFSVACGTYIAIKLIDNTKRARTDKKDLLDAQTKLEEMRAKNTTDLTTQITMLTTQISKDREHDREIREKELDAVNKLVTSSEETHGVIQSHVDATLAFRATMTTNTTALQVGVTAVGEGVTSANLGITRVEQSLLELKTALSDVPNAIRILLSPYCERMETALAKLETMRVEEKGNDDDDEQEIMVGDLSADGGAVGVHPSSATGKRGGSDGDTPHSDNGDVGGG